MLNFINCQYTLPKQNFYFYNYLKNQKKIRFKCSYIQNEKMEVFYSEKQRQIMKIAQGKKLVVKEVQKSPDLELTFFLVITSLSPLLVF